MSKKSLPIRVTNVTLKLRSDDSPDSTLATGLVELNSILNIRGRILKSKDGPFWKMPNFRIGEGDGARWYDYVFPTGEQGRELRDHINAKAVGHYELLLKNLSEEEETSVESDAELAEKDTPFEE